MMMQFDYRYKITFELNEPFDLDYVKRISEKYKDIKILVEVQNTKGITSSMIRQLNSNIAIRIAGGYDKNRINRYGKDLKWSSNYYDEAVIYSRNETIHILEFMENIEADMNKNWSDIQKLIYIYDRLKREIMYDPKCEYKLSSEIRSLRGLITKNTVCAGYAMIFKEFMDRNNIVCEYVEGYSSPRRTGGHAWNIVTIGGKKYPVDLTWDNSSFRSGNSQTFDWLGCDVETFAKSHYPAPNEATQDYRHTLSQIDPLLLKNIFKTTGAFKMRDYRTTTYYGIRKDGSKFIVAQVGDSRVNNHNFYRYYYVEIDENGNKKLPLLLYSDNNVTYLIDCKRFGKPIPNGYEEAIDNILFSKENIADSLQKKTFYIGAIQKQSTSNKTELVSSYKQIDKPINKRNMFIYPTRRLKRSDGSVFLVQQMFSKPLNINGVKAMQYDIFEMVKEDGKNVLKKNVVYTEKNLFKDNRQSVADYFLSRDYLNKRTKEAGGYIGYYSKDGTLSYNPNLVKYFGTSQTIELDYAEKVWQDVNNKYKIPSFDELKDFVSKYEVFIDSDVSKIKVKDNKTGQVQTDSNIITKAIFADLWLSAAGIKVFYDDVLPGEGYAFNDSARRLYEIIVSELKRQVREKGVIDTVDLFKNIENKIQYKYSKDIILKLFRTQYQVNFINDMILKSLNISNKGFYEPTPLYNESYVGRLY